jgi:hypothetical protein
MRKKVMQIGICLVPDEFRTVPKIPRFGDFKGQSLEFPPHTNSNLFNKKIK